VDGPTVAPLVGVVVVLVIVNVAGKDDWLVVPEVGATNRVRYPL